MKKVFLVSMIVLTLVVSAGLFWTYSDCVVYDAPHMGTGSQVTQDDLFIWRTYWVADHAISCVVKK